MPNAAETLCMKQNRGVETGAVKPVIADVEPNVTRNQSPTESSCQSSKSLIVVGPYCISQTQPWHRVGESGALAVAVTRMEDQMIRGWKIPR